MFTILSIVAALCQLLQLAIAAELRIQIPPSALLPNPNTLPSSTHATLTSGSGAPLDGLLRKDNTIVFSDVQTTGSHLLKIYTRDFVFAPYRIDITTSDDATSAQISGIYETYPGTKWTDHGVPLIASTTPVSTYTLYPKLLQRKNYYENRPAFSPLDLLKNPMILMGGVALIFTLGLPKLMEGMDPEMKAEYEEMQKKGPMANINKVMSGQGPASGAASNFDLAGYLASAQTGGAKSSGSGKEGSENIRERRK